MLTISAYRLVAQLYESANSVIYRGWRVSDEQPVVLSHLVSEKTGQVEIAP